MAEKGQETPNYGALGNRILANEMRFQEQIDLAKSAWERKVAGNQDHSLVRYQAELFGRAPGTGHLFVGADASTQAYFPAFLLTMHYLRTHGDFIAFLATDMPRDIARRLRKSTPITPSDSTEPNEYSSVEIYVGQHPEQLFLFQEATRLGIPFVALGADFSHRAWEVTTHNAATETTEQLQREACIYPDGQPTYRSDAMAAAFTEHARRDEPRGGQPTGKGHGVFLGAPRFVGVPQASLDSDSLCQKQSNHRLEGRLKLESVRCNSQDASFHDQAMSFAQAVQEADPRSVYRRVIVEAGGTYATQVSRAWLTPAAFEAAKGHDIRTFEAPKSLANNVKDCATNAMSFGTAIFDQDIMVLPQAELSSAEDLLAALEHRDL